MKFKPFMCLLLAFTAATYVFSEAMMEQQLKAIVAECEKDNVMEAPGYPNGYPCGRSTYDKESES